jgi:acyl-CoA synthetase (AMP-forming)/AMP-acid ligase II
LIERYSTSYWKILTEVSEQNYDRILAPTVSRHFDFIAELDKAKRLPVSLNKLKSAMAHVDFLIGSAPVGPVTVRRLLHYSGKLPVVRFGSTETCLQVTGTPLNLSEENKMETFQKGWDHKVGDDPLPGYYIGRPHPPYTDVRIVKSITPGQDGYMKDAAIGYPGYLITRGANLMSEYVNEPEKNGNVFHDGWYTGLQDICFALNNSQDQEIDYYWVSRESTMLIRGGANYAFDQINAELIQFVSDYYRLPKDAFDIAVVGLKIESEHEDSCCVTIELKSDTARSRLDEMKDTFIKAASTHVSKGAKPNYVCFAAIPRNFKGSILVKELAAEFKKWLLQTKL